jgi:hypothetical protein
MGNCSSCFKEKEYNEYLITNKYCYQCQVTFISNNEYNKHIPNCPKRYGDI